MPRLWKRTSSAFADAVIKAKPAGAKGNYVKRVAISSTMGPGVKIDPSSVHGRLTKFHRAFWPGGKNSRPRRAGVISGEMRNSCSEIAGGFRLNHFRPA